MSRYPRAVRNARIKCIACNAPVVETTDGEYVCVDCGESPLEEREPRRTQTTSDSDPVVEQSF